MSEKQKIFVVAVGMHTPIGLNTEMTVAAFNAGISGFAIADEHNKEYSPFTMSLIPEDSLPPLNPDLENIGLTTRQRRMLRIATSAIAEIMDEHAFSEPLPLFLSGPESIPDCPTALRPDFIKLLSVQTGCKFNNEMSRTIATGRSGGLEAIDMAFRYLSASGADFALVGGVDSYLSLYLLGTMDMQDRVLAENIVDGFAPGEASGFLLLATVNGLKQLGKPAMCTLYVPGIAKENGHKYSDKPFMGDGLASAVYMAAQNSDIRNGINKIYSGMNGESYHAKEYGVAVVRNKQLFSEEFSHEHPADCFGDIGAAFAPVLIGIHAFTEKVSNESVLICCSSDMKLRSSIVAQ